MSPYAPAPMHAPQHATKRSDPKRSARARALTSERRQARAFKYAQH